MPRIMAGGGLLWLLTAAAISLATAAEHAAQWSGVVLRIEFIFAERGIQSVGTGFVIRDRHRNQYLVTCAHLLNDKDWQTRYSVRMRTMDGQQRIESLGTSLLAGSAINLHKPLASGWPDMTQDLVVRPVAGSWSQPLRLATKDPEPGQWVWAVGCEVGKPPGDEQLFPGRVTEVANGGFVFEKAVAFNPKGFSGGPVVDSKGEVVGNVLAGAGKLVSGATTKAMRRRLDAIGVDAE
jgi:hypothetical protein